MAVNSRAPHYLEISENKFMELQLKKSSYTTPLLQALGMQLTKPSQGAIAASKADAYANGAIGITVSYERTSNKYQQAVLLCSPTKVETVLSEVVGKSYNGGPIRSASFPKPRCYC